MNERSRTAPPLTFDQQDIVAFRVVQHRPAGRTMNESLGPNGGNRCLKISALKEQDGFVAGRIRFQPLPFQADAGWAAVEFCVTAAFLVRDLEAEYRLIKLPCTIEILEV